MNIIEDRHGPISIFKLHGRADSVGAVELERALEQAVSENCIQIVLDLSEVTYINSVGLRILAAVLTANQARGGDLLLATPLPKIRRVLQIVGFDKFFRMYESVEAAVGAF